MLGNELGAAVLQLTFPGFRGDDPSVEDLEPLVRAGVDFIHITGVPRRFSGDRSASLPRGKYYTICADEFGRDAGTLVQELLAYTSLRDEQLTVHSANAADDADLLNRLGSHANAALVVFLKPGEGANAVLETLIGRGMIGAEARTQGHMFVFELHVEHVRIDSVCDLRAPDMQQWLIETLPPGDDVLRADFLHRLRDFREMLGALMYVDHGGSEFTDAFGTWMRNRGANGIVFPSARMNNELHLRGQEMVGFLGWNFVDFRGAAPLATGATYFGDWPIGLVPGTEVHLGPKDSEYARSWKVRGNEEGHRAERNARQS